MKKICLIFMTWLVICASTLALPIDYKALYSSENFVSEVNKYLETLAQTYPTLCTLSTVGYSTANQSPIQCLKLGNGSTPILINANHHAREYMTTLLTLYQINYMLDQYNQNVSLDNYTYRNLFNIYSFYFIPMLNPDGIQLVKTQNPSWKANGRGVDLNSNYPTPKSKPSTGYPKAPAPQGYRGEHPFSEQETLALKALCETTPFALSLSYHSAGEVTYWYWHQEGQCLQDSKRLLNVVKQHTLYKPLTSPYGLGFTDWFIQTFDKPAFTLEIGTTVNGKPLPFSAFDRAIQQNKDLPMYLAIELLKMNASGTIKTFDNTPMNIISIHGKDMVLFDQYARKYKIDYRVREDCVYFTLNNLSYTFKLDSLTYIAEDVPLQTDLPSFTYNNHVYLSFATLETLRRTVPMIPLEPAEPLVLETPPIEQTPSEEALPST